MSADWPQFPHQGGHPGFVLPTFETALARFVGRRVKVITDCKTIRGRLVQVGLDFIHLKKHGKVILIRSSRVCAVKIKRDPVGCWNS